MTSTAFRLVLLLALFTTVTAQAEPNWSRWRGPLMSGHYDGKLPVKWTSKNLAYRVALPGEGQSSPVLWGDRVFLTAAEAKGVTRIVICLDRHTGKLLWKQQAWKGVPENSHAMNHWASSTCATDGERVVAFFGKAGLHCYDLEGTLLWSRDLGTFEGPWGTAASPLIYNSLVIQNCDADDQAFLLAVNKETGETVWKTPRTKIRGWSSPIVVNSAGRDEIVLNSHNGVRGYDPKTGKELWFCSVARGRGTPTVTPYNDLLVCVPGRPGDMVAMRGGGSGDVTESRAVWRTPRRAGRDLPSPIVVGQYLVVFSLRPGVVTCYEAANGKELWKQRLTGNFSASPIAADGLIYMPSEAGTVYVIKPGKQAEVVARNEISPGEGEIFRASLTPVEGQLLLRSNKALYCIGRNLVSLPRSATRGRDR